MKKYLLMGLLIWSAGQSPAQDLNNIAYLCCDWGPAMTLPVKAGDQPKFSDTEDEVYFLKQVGTISRKKSLLKSLMGSRNVENIGKGISIWLCKMKADGSGKTEIKELWRNPQYPIDTQGQSTWLDVNRRSRRLALSITFAGSDLTGLWTMNLDGSGFKRIITPTRNSNYLQAINHASWTLAGDGIYFEEELRGMNPNRFNIAKCDASGTAMTRIFEADGKIQYREPRVSPDGKQIAFVRYPNGYPGGSFVWSANLDGTAAAPVGGKETRQNCGTYPAWSPDGDKLFYIGISCCILDTATGNKLAQQVGHSGWPHWGRLGLIGYNLGGIIFTDSERKESKRLATSGTANSSENKSDSGRW